MNYPENNNALPAGLHPQIKASLYPNNSAEDRETGPQSTEQESWAELIDTRIYPRIKFRERYMETPEAPYR